MKPKILRSALEHRVANMFLLMQKCKSLDELFKDALKKTHYFGV
jgi:hypothetical protein